MENDRLRRVRAAQKKLMGDIEQRQQIKDKPIEHPPMTPISPQILLKMSGKTPAGIIVHKDKWVATKRGYMRKVW